MTDSERLKQAFVYTKMQKVPPKSLRKHPFSNSSHDARNEDYIIIKFRKDTSKNRENQSEDGL